MGKGQSRGKNEGQDPEQSRRFIEAARELDADQSEEALDEALRKVAKAPRQPHEQKKPR